MSDFVLGADSSNSVQFIAVVLGMKTDVAKLRNRVCTEHGIKRIHMRKIIERSKVAQTVSKYSTSSVHMYCFNVDRAKHSATLESARKTQFMSSSQKNQNIDYCIAMEIKNAISGSLGLFYQNWSELLVEADTDTKKMFQGIGLTVVLEDCAYELADAVAWANNAGSTMNQVREVDISSNVDLRLRKKLKM